MFKSPSPSLPSFPLSLLLWVFLPSFFWSSSSRLSFYFIFASYFLSFSSSSFVLFINYLLFCIYLLMLLIVSWLAPELSLPVDAVALLLELSLILPSASFRSWIYLLMRLISVVLPKIFFSFSVVRLSNYLIRFSKFYFSDSLNPDYAWSPFDYYFDLSVDYLWELLEPYFSRLLTRSVTLESRDARSVWLALRSFKQSIIILKFFTTISSFRLHSTFTVTVFSSWIYPSFCIISNKIIVYIDKIIKKQSH